MCLRRSSRIGQRDRRAIGDGPGEREDIRAWVSAQGWPPGKPECIRDPGMHSGPGVNRGPSGWGGVYCWSAECTRSKISNRSVVLTGR
ncbi:hypothetical protein DFQ13_12319 [Actinokineospora spheciospongiae]|nr:hypothetical protein DFQ13_12319 [Actinokineospora spheciospongiae]